MSQSLEGHVAVVSGAASGIGAVYARRLAERGADVAVGDLNPTDATESVITGLGRRAFGHRLDVADEASVAEFASAVLEHFGTVDILVNNAGIYPFISFDDMTFADWRRVLAINLDGSFLMVKQFVPAMRKAGWGRIVNVASSESWMPAPMNLHYIASKMGVVGLTRALATEVGDDGITVNAIAPGITGGTSIDTMAAHYLEELPKTQAIKRAATPDDLADVVAFLASDDARFITAQTIVADGGMVRI